MTNDSEFLNPHGTIPQSAILRVGEQRRAPGGQPKADAGAESDDEPVAEAADLEG